MTQQKVNSLRKVNLLKKVAQKSLFYVKVTQKSDKYSKKEITQKSFSAKKSMILPSNGPDGPPIFVSCDQYSSLFEH